MKLVEFHEVPVGHEFYDPATDLWFIKDDHASAHQPLRERRNPFGSDEMVEIADDK